MSLHFPRLRNWLLSSPPAEWALSHVRQILVGALRQGPIPQHVAFVMDGNRRYAKSHHIETLEGHSLGFEALARILDVCYRTGVKVVTLYAFSVENFKRSKYEVGGLMEMAKLKLDQVTQHGEMLNKYGARIQVLGQRELLPQDVQDKINRAVGLSKHNSKAVLNVCFPYTSRDEITSAVRKVVEDYLKPSVRGPPSRSFSQNHIVRNIQSNRLSTLKEESSGSDEGAEQDSTKSLDPSAFLGTPSENSAFSSSSTLNNVSPDGSASHSPHSRTSDATYPDPEQITSDELNSKMYTADNPPLDLLVRTSGVERLSDFMLWQCHEHTTIVFVQCLWPEFDLWKFLPVLVEWQWWRWRNLEYVARNKASARLKAL
ncbi:MAG: hypothetical protein Q9159_000507 [Coniocarpon cinnabarinum]